MNYTNEKEAEIVLLLDAIEVALANGGGSGGGSVTISTTPANLTTDFPVFYNNTGKELRQSSLSFENLIQSSATIIALQANQSGGRFTR
jgi:hypothetical protein